MEHTRTHPTKHLGKIHSLHTGVIILTNNHDTYAIPKKIAEKYLVKPKSKTNVTSTALFAELERRLTKAGALLKGLRTRENLSQVEFAKKIKVTQANLSKMENGHRPIGKTIAKRIEKVFGVNYRYFLE